MATGAVIALLGDLWFNLFFKVLKRQNSVELQEKTYLGVKKVACQNILQMDSSHLIDHVFFCYKNFEE